MSDPEPIPSTDLPPVVRYEGHVRRVEDHPLPERNYLGYRSETISAEYETDQALAEAQDNVEDPYFRAAWAAEDRLRTEDQDPSTHEIDCTCFLCIPGA